MSNDADGRTLIRIERLLERIEHHLFMLSSAHMATADESVDETIEAQHLANREKVKWPPR